MKIKALETGYYPRNLECTQEEVDNMNLEIGITRAVSKAMEDSSMFGWDKYLGLLEMWEKRFTEKEKQNDYTSLSTHS